jgi:putative glycosyltransferase (TIGR04348 family)
MSARLLIACPATASQNNGNWHGAARLRRFLRASYRVAIAAGWTVDDAAPDLLIALHARRSAAAVAAFRARHPDRPCIVVLTGTDLYRDIAADADAQATLALATHLVLLQDDGLAHVPAALRHKCTVIFQSARALAPAAPNADVLMLGHLRAEKDPLTFMRAASLVRSARPRLVQAGAALEPALGEAARATQRDVPRYDWIGALPHARARQRLKRSRALALPSLMEGGANVSVEAVTCGVPVLASRVSGNLGMLGADYAGYFPAGDAQALAVLIDRLFDDAAFDARLRAQCAARAPLFAPAAEQAAWLALVDNALLSRP